jgi:hypothetical protein
MSSNPVDERDGVIPAAGEQLLAGFQRHGIRPGQRVHRALVVDSEQPAGERRSRRETWEQYAGTASEIEEPDHSVAAKERSSVLDGGTDLVMIFQHSNPGFVTISYKRAIVRPRLSQ